MPSPRVILENPNAYIEEANRLNNKAINGYKFEFKHDPLPEPLLSGNVRQVKTIDYLKITDPYGNSVDFQFCQMFSSVVASHGMLDKNAWENFTLNFPEKDAPFFYDFLVNHCPDYRVEIDNSKVCLTNNRY